MISEDIGRKTATRSSVLTDDPFNLADAVSRSAPAGLSLRSYLIPKVSTTQNSSGLLFLVDPLLRFLRREIVGLIFSGQCLTELILMRREIL